MSTASRRAGSTTANSSLSRIRVAVRVRPVTGKDGGAVPPTQCVEADVDPEGDHPPELHFSHESVRKAFAFDHVFPTSSTQEDVYSGSLRPFLSPFLNGFNVTVIAYGQTGAGKTFTVGRHTSLGPSSSPEAPRSAEKTVASPEDGLIPRFLVDLFESLRSEPSVKTIHVSFLEIYCDEIHDLLSNARPTGIASHGRGSMGTKTTAAAKERPLMIRDDEHRATVQNLTQIQVETAAKALELMNLGRARQATGSNALNSQSSRSHAIYTVEVARKFARDIKNAKLTFVDLAGSERLQKTNVQGMVMKESIQINVGLLALSTVINALREDRQHKRRQSVDSSGMNGDTVSFVPYRSSKLTRLLRDALGGNSMSLFIACVSPTTSNSSETLCTLQFADRVSCIQNKAQKNVEAVVSASGPSSPRRSSTPASPRNSMKGRSASEIEINRLHEQILMLKHQLDAATTEVADSPVKCTKYESALLSNGSKLTPPRAITLPQSRNPSIQEGSDATRPRSASTSQVPSLEDIKPAVVRPSMLVLPRPAVFPVGSSSANAPAKPPRSSIALKLFVERLNASKSATCTAPTSCSTVEQRGSSDQQSVNDCNDSSHNAKSPTRDGDGQPYVVETEDASKPEKSPLPSVQPSIQVFHTRRRSSSSALAIPSVSAKLQSFMESVKPPTQLPARERSDSLPDSTARSPGSPRSPRSSPSSPSSASTSSVSPMSTRRQSLASTTGTGAAKSALAAFMDKVKPNWHVSSLVAASSGPLWGEEDLEPEQIDGGGDTSANPEPKGTLGMKQELREGTETSSADEGQLEQDDSTTQPAQTTLEDRISELRSGQALASEPTEEQSDGLEDEEATQTQCEDAFRSPAALDEDAEALESPSPSMPTLDELDESRDDQQYVMIADTTPEISATIETSSSPVSTAETPPRISSVCAQLENEVLKSPPPYNGPIYPSDPLDDRLATIDQASQCDSTLVDTPRDSVAAQRNSVPPSDFTIDRRHWRDNVRRHFSSKRKQLPPSMRPHPFNWFPFHDATDVRHTETSNNPDSNSSLRLQQLLAEVQQLVHDEIGHCNSQLPSHNNTQDVPDLLDDMRRLLDHRSQCQQRVDTLKLHLGRLTRLLGPSPPPTNLQTPPTTSITVNKVSIMTDEELGRFKLNHQGALLRAALSDCEAQALGRLQLRVLHFQLASEVVNPPPSDVFLTREQVAACQSALGCDLLPLVLTGYVSVSLQDVQAEHAWLSL